MSKLLEKYNKLVPKFIRIDPHFPFYTPNHITIDLRKLRPQGKYLFYFTLYLYYIIIYE
jgi:hypothetical protein